MVKKPRKVILHELGRLGYMESFAKQQSAEKALKEITQDKEDDPPYHGLLFLVEHNPIYTTGVREHGYDEKFAERLKSLNAEFYKSNRGGLITFHGPGQLVAYPIIYLKYFNLNVRTYVDSIQSTIIKLCELYGLKAYTCEHTGVWVNDSKICALGVRCSKFVTTHGLALNCNTDLNWFSHIVPCGIEGKGVTSLSKELEEKETLRKFGAPEICPPPLKSAFCLGARFEETTFWETVRKNSERTRRSQNF
nr:PREDICTED: putative lipoyltransferase 2, mitochondrial isoform X2 [Bemisia tabaci]